MVENLESDGEFQSVSEVSEFLGVSNGTVRKWLRHGRLVGAKPDGRWAIPSVSNRDFYLEIIRKRWDSPLAAYVPEEIGDYHRWHQVVDEIAWLLKVCYSDSQVIRSKSFRSDQLFLSYLERNRVTLGRVSHQLASRSRATMKAVSDDLKRGWYNELAFLTPLKPSTLGLSFSDIEKNLDSSNERFSFLAWRITQAYYAVYFYLRSLTSIKFGGFRYEEHRAPISAFKTQRAWDT
ncbi:MAG: helix-turn-helix domain-containing protein [Acidobacteria bacterium]|nr:helix-turn-helix domain-containing protein [Acidobacteriota bacterium]